MVELDIRGKHDVCSKEEIRAMVCASAIVMEFHNRKLSRDDKKGLIEVIFTTEKKLGVNHVTGGKTWGNANPRTGVSNK